MNSNKRVNLLEIPMPNLAGFDLSKEMLERPYTVLGAGLLAGYLLGGGLFSRLSIRALSLGVRLVALPAITRAATGVLKIPRL